MGKRAAFSTPRAWPRRRVPAGRLRSTALLAPVCLDDAAHVADGRVNDLVGVGVRVRGRGRSRVRVRVRARVRVRVRVRVRAAVNAVMTWDCGQG